MLPVVRNILLITFLSMPCMVMAQDEEYEKVADTVVAPATDDEATETIVGADDYTQEAETPAQPELRVVPDSSVNKLKQDESFAYANDPAYWTKEKEQQEVRSGRSFWDYFYEFFSGNGVRTVTYIILGVIFVLIIYRIVVVNNLFMTAASRRRTETTEEPETEIDDNNLDAKIQAAIQERNYRAAIRFMYIKSLRSLHEKGWIRYHAQATNNEYISQVHPYGVGNEFRFLTHVYEYVWYGEFALSEEQFNRVQQNFQHFFNAVKP